MILFFLRIPRFYSIFEFQRNQGRGGHVDNENEAVDPP